MIMNLYAHLHCHKVLGTWLLTFYEQGIEDSSITDNCFIAGYRSASICTWHQQPACFFAQH